MFERMLQHENIRIELGVEFEAIRKKVQAGTILYAGPIDAYFGECYGRLPYRSLLFEHVHLEKTGPYQPVGTVDYPNDFDFTRFTEFKHLTGQKHEGTSIVREYQRAEGYPYYPRTRTTIFTSATRGLQMRSRTRCSSDDWRNTATTTIPLLQHGPGGGCCAYT